MSFIHAANHFAVRMLQKSPKTFLKASNIKLRARKKTRRSFKNKKQYAQGVKDSKKDQGLSSKD